MYVCVCVCVNTVVWVCVWGGSWLVCVGGLGRLVCVCVWGGYVG